jgi:hypothetical protein
VIVGAFGNAILFVCFGVLLVIVGTYAVALATHCYLVVVQGTTAGIDRVEWPDEPIYDWILQALWLGGLVVISLALASIANRILAAAGVPDPMRLRWFLLAGGALWLFFPFSLLSSLASSSRWFIVSPRVFVRLLRLFPSVVVFYVAAGLLLALLGPILYVGLLLPKTWLALPVASALGGAVLLIHARLVGRLAWLLDQLDRKPAAPKRKATTEGKRARPRRPAVVSDPWAVPPDDEPEEAPPLAGYRVVEEPVKEQPRHRSPTDLEPPDPYTVANAPPTPAGETPRRPEGLDEHRVQREIELRTRTPPNPPPALPMFSGVYTFPAYPTSTKVLVWLTVWGALTMAVMRAVLMFAPFQLG